jgi:hypothetical protein
MSFESISNSGESVSPKPLVQGVLDWNKWRLDNPTVDLDLSGTNLAAAGLSESDFVGHGSCSPTTAR